MNEIEKDYQVGWVEEGGGDCSQSCAAYRLDCLECETSNISATYYGETGRNGYSRVLKHIAGLKNKNKTTHCEALFNSAQW